MKASWQIEADAGAVAGKPFASFAEVGLYQREVLNAENQRENIRIAAGQLAEIHKTHQLIIAHGNGPQVGNLLLQQESCSEVPKMPLEIIGAMTQGQIGYMLLGIALGVAALIVILSVMNGFEGELRGRLLSMSAHGFVTGNDGVTTDWRQLARDVEAEGGVAAAAPIVELEGMIQSGRDLERLVDLFEGFLAEVRDTQQIFSCAIE